MAARIFADGSRWRWKPEVRVLIREAIDHKSEDREGILIISKKTGTVRDFKWQGMLMEDDYKTIMFYNEKTDITALLVCKQGVA